MSWNKNTINASEVDATIKVLKKIGTPYQVEELGTVQGMGLNDDYFGSGEYNCRKLTYGNTVLMEQMSCHSDCDMDDYFVSVEFEKGKEPRKEDWKLSVCVDDEEE